MLDSRDGSFILSAVIYFYVPLRRDTFHGPLRLRTFRQRLLEHPERLDDGESSSKLDSC